MSARFTEPTVEEAALARLAALGWGIANGPEIAPRELLAERKDFSEVFVHARRGSALARLNPDIPEDALHHAVQKLTHPEGATLEARNRAVHRMLFDGVTVEFKRSDGSIAGAQARVIDFDDPSNKDFLAVDPFAVIENKHHRRIDVALDHAVRKLTRPEGVNRGSPARVTKPSSWQNLDIYG